jgi:hypothetical protein
MAAEVRRAVGEAAVLPAAEIGVVSAAAAISAAAARVEIGRTILDFRFWIDNTNLDNLYI